jgi:CBS domain containing-hemolysin-like protein
VIEILLLLAAALLILACGAFVAAEFAFLTVNRPEVSAAAAAGDRKAVGVQSALKSLSTQLSGAQVGITVTNLTIGFIAQPSIATLVEGPLTGLGLSEGAAVTVSIVLALVLATGLTMIFGELVPKNLAIAKPLATARAVQGFMRGFTKSTAHLIRFFNGTANAILRMFGIQPTEELASARSAEELAELVRHSAVQGTLAPETAEWVQRTLAFGDRRARDVMTHRGQMTTLPASAPVHDLIALAKQTGHSRFPVLAPGDGDGGVVGIAHVRRALEVPFAERGTVGVERIMLPPVLLPDTIELDDLLDTLSEGNLQIAILIDEFGDLAGLVTLEDLVEEIVGEVRDEHDTDEQLPHHAPDGSWLVPGGMRPDEATDLTGVAIPESEDYDTLAGLVVVSLGRLAREGDQVTISTADIPGQAPGTIVLTVTAMDDHRIDQIRLTLPAAPPGGPDTADDSDDKGRVSS